ncbi:hypothetical protein BO82DRAFT_86187 [Aspergillus uvarum CBS 121591]|uniref:Uncharacterized protein n=1 Tax=Aspergillus uvarum CBS 121591 TaxID=1448315 RepID=A0A319D5X9_9EURO|nr:hypothetical protein BO82DRAFT_86187 [Aspergillus uvarum CBS 121591]PYH86383.1 hypothetical protein BO82DRAFT_86187 [Aspergillus uvarum CBS 121591]
MHTPWSDAKGPLHGDLLISSSPASLSSCFATISPIPSTHPPASRHKQPWGFMITRGAAALILTYSLFVSMCTSLPPVTLGQVSE